MPKKWGPDPAEPESYVAIDPAILQAIKELAGTADRDRHVMPTIRAVLRVARIDPVTGNVVIGIRLTRDLNQPPE
jgi:hypothetical protein